MRAWQRWASGFVAVGLHLAREFPCPTLFAGARPTLRRWLNYGLHFSLPFDEARAEQLVRSGLKIMGVSIDGARQQAYEQYRVNGRFEVVLRNVELIAEAKRRLGSRTPRVIWSYHMFEHNVDEVASAQTMADRLGVELHVSRGRVVGPDWDSAERRIPHEHVEPMPCYTLFHTAVVYADGSVAPCRGSFYPQDDLGRLAGAGHSGAATFREVWHGEGFRTARRFFRGRSGTAEERSRICFNCPSVVDWHRYVEHVVGGGTPAEWTPLFDSNQRYNYFWTRGRRTSHTNTAGDTRQRAEAKVSDALRSPAGDQ